MKHPNRRLAALLVGPLLTGAAIALASSPLAAEESRKTMSSTRKTMSSSRAGMKSTRRTGSSEVRRGSSSSTSTVRGSYSSATRPESELKSQDSSLSGTSLPGYSPAPDAADGDRGADPNDNERDWLNEYRADREDGKEVSRRDQYDNRTLGKACILGAGGRVVYRPPGAVCAGDAAAAGRKPPPAPSVQVPASAAKRAAPRRPKDCGGRCIYGGGGRVVYAPAGCSC